MRDIDPRLSELYCALAAKQQSLVLRWDLMRFLWRGKLRAQVEDVDFALGTTIDPEVSAASRRLQVIQQYSFHCYLVDQHQWWRQSGLFGPGQNVDCRLLQHSNVC